MNNKSPHTGTKDFKDQGQVEARIPPRQRFGLRARTRFDNEIQRSGGMASSPIERETAIDLAPIGNPIPDV